MSSKPEQHNPIPATHNSHNSISSSPRPPSGLAAASPRTSNLSLPDVNGRSSTPKGSRERSISRPSSRTSNRTHNTAISLDSSVAVRNQMSTLKHSIRQQQAQLQNLESSFRTSSRSYPTEPLDETFEMDAPVFSSRQGSSSGAAPPSSFVSPGSPSTSPSTSSLATAKMKRRSSYEVLQDIAGRESNLPLPKRSESSLGMNSPLENGAIQEGVPMTFGNSQNGSYTTPTKRNSSPTRTLSRIPISSVGKTSPVPYFSTANSGSGNARMLADESPRAPPTTKSLSVDGHNDSFAPAPSPSKRFSFTSGNTTKVLADLQTGVVNARNALENTKSQLRLSQRTVSQLTRLNEDLKESRERLRLENEGLNNVVARKERLLQEVLERARKAEAEAAQLKQQLKSETTVSKKALREMESALAESTALSSKSEREYLTLRDSMKGMVESWKRDTDRLRDEINKREAKHKAEAEKIGKDYKQLMQEMKKAEKGKEDLKKLKEDNEVKNVEVEKMWTDEIAKMRADLDKSHEESEKAVRTAQVLEEELARLRRMMRLAGREAAEKEKEAASSDAPS
ncbi:hypothetical protein BKA70DRAFT_469573 [Coprinopsis sp. MPI-PUGE-AT-0042]|nr:hypothetical protein BKA70DRAFT_469573 [Coprinopsis sp. MPI-PUGE-AT-0042]